MSPWPIRLSLVAALCWLVVGCSSEGPVFKVAGSVVDDGKPVLPDPQTSIQIVFVPKTTVSGHSRIYSAELKADDATFTMLGHELKGIPAGKYQVKLSSVSLNPSPAIQNLNRRFSGSNSPIEIEVIDEKTPITIDLAKYKGK